MSHEAKATVGVGGGHFEDAHFAICEECLCEKCRDSFQLLIGALNRVTIAVVMLVADKETDIKVDEEVEQ